MYQIIHYLDESGADVYQAWLDSLRDRVAKVAIIRRVARLELGLFGDCKPLREGISELRIDVGTGYRVYYAQVGKQQMLATQLRECGANLRGTQIARVTPFVNIHKPARQIDELLLGS